MSESDKKVSIQDLNTPHLNGKLEGGKNEGRVSAAQVQLGGLAVRDGDRDSGNADSGSAPSPAEVTSKGDEAWKPSSGLSSPPSSPSTTGTSPGGVGTERTQTAVQFLNQQILELREQRAALTDENVQLKRDIENLNKAWKWSAEMTPGERAPAVLQGQDQDAAGKAWAKQAGHQWATYCHEAFHAGANWRRDLDLEIADAMRVQAIEDDDLQDDGVGTAVFIREAIREGKVTRPDTQEPHQERNLKNDAREYAKGSFTDANYSIEQVAEMAFRDGAAWFYSFGPRWTREEIEAAKLRAKELLELLSEESSDDTRETK